METTFKLSCTLVAKAAALSQAVTMAGSIVSRVSSVTIFTLVAVVSMVSQ